MRFEIKAMETPAEIEGKGYVHWKGWQEAYRGLIDPAYLETMTLDICVKRAYEWRDDVLVAKDGPRVVGFAGYGPYRDDALPGAGELYALYVLREYYGTGAGPALLEAALEQLAGYPRVKGAAADTPRPIWGGRFWANLGDYIPQTPFTPPNALGGGKIQMGRVSGPPR